MEYFDPYIPSYREHGIVKEGIKEINPEIIASYDIVIVTAAHTNIDYDMVQKNAKIEKILRYCNAELLCA